MIVLPGNRRRTARPILSPQHVQLFAVRLPSQAPISVFATPLKDADHRLAIVGGVGVIDDRLARGHHGARHGERQNRCGNHWQAPSLRRWSNGAAAIALAARAGADERSGRRQVYLTICCWAQCRLPPDLVRRCRTSCRTESFTSRYGGKSCVHCRTGCYVALARPRTCGRFPGQLSSRPEW